MHVLIDIIPARYRKAVVWAPFAAWNLFLGAWAAYAGAVESYTLPEAYLGLAAITNFVAGAVGLVGYANVNQDVGLITTDPVTFDEDADIDGDLVDAPDDPEVPETD